ncbi:20369_t:CDS:2 [Rhizophagus irregularis]|nr:20369_t:CDS:2 [Rhizophagus irregularis]
MLTPLTPLTPSVPSASRFGLLDLSFKSDQTGPLASLGSCEIGDFLFVSAFEFVRFW